MYNVEGVSIARRNSLSGGVVVGVWRDVDRILVCKAGGFVVGVVVGMMTCWVAP